MARGRGQAGAGGSTAPRARGADGRSLGRPPPPATPQAWLTGGRWLPLLPPGHPGLAEVKWCVNRFRPFLVVEPEADADPGSRDLEEVSLEVRARAGRFCVCGCAWALVAAAVWAFTAECAGLLRLLRALRFGAAALGPLRLRVLGSCCCCCACASAAAACVGLLLPHVLGFCGCACAFATAICALLLATRPRAARRHPPQHPKPRTPNPKPRTLQGAARVVPLPPFVPSCLLPLSFAARRRSPPNPKP